MPITAAAARTTPPNTGSPARTLQALRHRGDGCTRRAARFSASSSTDLPMRLLLQDQSERRGSAR
jgi:hypothetical protein